MDTLTGHPEIDRQHEELSRIMDGLNTTCHEARTQGDGCSSCSPERFEECNNRLADLITAILGFMLDHFAYEEKLMRFLPNSEKCNDHKERHRRAHAEISQMLSKLTARLDRDNPRQSSIHLHNIMHAWMGGHTQNFDTALASNLADVQEIEINFDRELTKLLSEEI